MSDTSIKNAVKVPQSTLEQKLIKDYLHSKGYTRQDLLALPIKQVRQLMTEACTYASLRLAEISARSQFQQKIHYEESK